MNLTLSPTDSLNDVITRYPISVGFFVEDGASGVDWNLTVTEYVQDRNYSVGELEDELKDHLRRAVRPDDDCHSIRCAPLPFCPDEINLNPIVTACELFVRIVRRLITKTFNYLGYSVPY